MLNAQLSDPATLVLIALAFLLAGTVKGVVGFGLPTIALALLTATLGLSQAMALFLVPSIVTNIWQATAGGHAREIWPRVWPFLLAAFLSVWIGALALARVEEAYLSALLGIILIVYALVSLTRFQPRLSPAQARWTGPLVGVVNGVITGMTGTFVVPGVIFLRALELARDQLIQAMGMLFATSTLALGLALGGYGRLSPELGLLSALAVLPAMAGMILGRRIREGLSEALFGRIFFLALMGLGGYIIVRALA
jgi:uncharacterized membrane protein YfcA